MISSETIKLGCGEWMVPGGPLTERGLLAQSLGYRGLELFGDKNLPERKQELQDARRSGVIIPTICAIDTFIGDIDVGRRSTAVAHVKSLINILAEVGEPAGRNGVIIPATFGLFSRALPPHDVPRSPEEDKKILLDALSNLGQHAEENGVYVIFEPLNRYEDWNCNTVGSAATWVREVNSPAVKVMGDTFHMSHEEDDMIVPLFEAQDVLAHMHFADNQRNQPGTGQIDFAPIIKTLQTIGYSGYLTLECSLRGEDRKTVLEETAKFLQNYIS